MLILKFLVWIPHFLFLGVLGEASDQAAITHACSGMADGSGGRQGQHGQHGQQEAARARGKAFLRQEALSMSFPVLLGPLENQIVLVTRMESSRLPSRILLERGQNIRFRLKTAQAHVHAPSLCLPNRDFPLASGSVQLCGRLWPGRPKGRRAWPGEQIVPARLGPLRGRATQGP